MFPVCKIKRLLVSFFSSKNYAGRYCTGGIIYGCFGVHILLFTNYSELFFYMVLVSFMPSMSHVYLKKNVIQNFDLSEFQRDTLNRVIQWSIRVSVWASCFDVAITSGDLLIYATVPYSRNFQYNNQVEKLSLKLLVAFQIL